MYCFSIGGEHRKTGRNVRKSMSPAWKQHNYIFKQIDVDLLKMEPDTYFITD